MERRIVAKQVAEKLNTVELQIDQTLIAAGALLAALPEARSRANLSAVVGQEALDLVAEATMILTQARGRLVQAHHALAATGREIGVGKITAGFGDKPPPEGAADPGSRPFAVVESAA